MLKKLILHCVLSVLLFGCSSQGCLDPLNITDDTDKITDIVYAIDSGVIKDDYKTYWTKSKFVIPNDFNESSIDLEIFNNNLNVCAQSFQEFDILASDSLFTKPEKIPLNFSVLKGDAIFLQMSPALKGVFDDNTCNNLKKGIYVEDTEECQKRIGESYEAMIDENSSPPNYIFQDYKNKKKWISGNSYVMRSSKKRVKTKQEEDYDKIIYSDHKKYLCNPSYKDSNANFDSYIKSVINSYTSQELNNLCENFCCSYGYDANTKKISQKDSGGNCAMSQATVLNSDINQSIAYLQDIRIYYESRGNTKIFLDEAPSSSIRPGVRFGYRHKITEDVKDFYFEYHSKNFINLQNYGGGYKVMLTKDCSEFIENRALYYVISDAPPLGLPGEVGQHINISVNANNISLNTKNKGFEKVTIDVSKINPQGKNIYYAINSPYIKDFDLYSKNTSGYLSISVNSPVKKVKFISNIINYVDKVIKDKLYHGNQNIDSGVSLGAATVVYARIIGNSNFIKMVRALLILYILMYSLYNLLGRSRLSIYEIFLACFKIGIIVILLGPQSWHFFYTHLFQLFISFPLELSNIMSGADNNFVMFDFIDDILARFVNYFTWVQVISLILSGVVGIFMAVLICWGIFVIIQCLFSLIVVYLLSLVVITLLISIAPLFVICILFKRTSLIFKNWITTLIQSSMRPVIGFMIVALLSDMMGNVMASVFNFQVCKQCILSVNLQDLKIPSLSFCMFSFFIPIGYTTSMTLSDSLREADAISQQDNILSFLGMPLSITGIIIFVILCNALRSLVAQSSMITISIFGSFADIGEVASSMGKSLASSIGMDEQSRSGRYSIRKGLVNAANRGFNALRGGGGRSSESDSSATVPRKDTQANSAHKFLNS